MDQTPTTSPIAIVTCDPLLQIRAIQASKGRLSQKLDVMFHYIPGVSEFLQTYSAYVQNLPSAGGGTIFEQAVGKGVEAVDRLGLTPISVDAHLKGFPVFVRQLISVSSDLLQLQVVDKNANVWDPLSGPLGKFVARHEDLTVTFEQVSRNKTKEELLKCVILSHCLDFPRFRALSQVWHDVAA